MSLRARVTTALLATALALSVVVWYSAIRLRHWNEIGLTGLAYMQPLPEGKQPPLEIFKPGRVLTLYPTGNAENAGLQMGDVIVSINGVAMNENDKLIAKAAPLRTGAPITYRVKRGTRTLDIATKLGSPLDIPLFVATLIVNTIVGGAHLTIALLVLAKRPDDRRVLVFFAMMAVGAIYVLVAPALTLDVSDVRGLHAETSGRNLLPFVLMMAASIPFLPLTLHLALIFPKDRPIVRSSPHVFRWVYGIPAVFVALLVMFGLVTKYAMTSRQAARSLDLPLNSLTAVLTIAGFLVAWRIARLGRVEGTRQAFWRRPFQSIFFGIAAILAIARIAGAIGIGWLAFAVGFFVALAIIATMAAFPVLSCMSLYRSYRDAGVEERRQVKWPLWGTISALATRVTIAALQAPVIWAVFSGADTGGWLRGAQFIGVFSTLVYLLIPISFAVAILKYRLMNIDVIIRKTVVYALLSSLILFIYLALVGVLGTILVTYAGVKNQITIIGATLIVALLFVPMRNKLQTLVERNLFRQKYDYPEAVRAVGAEALRAGDAGVLLASAAEKTQRALQNRAVVMFVSRHGDYVAAAKVGVSDSVIGALRVPHSPMASLLSAPFDPRRTAVPEDAGGALKKIEAALIVPINTPGTPANGFIALAPKLSGGEFDEEDIGFLRSLASQLDIGLDRIRQQREDVDYSQARDIQQGLLPREMPRVAGVDVSGTWQPARTMGGDYYDLLTLSDTELAICIGDVAGKGMPAALLMSGLQAAVRASASSSSRDLCERVRRVVVSSLTGGRFVTFFYATIDTAAMTLRWTNAGHNAPILARDDGTMRRLEEGGPAISRLLRDTPYTEHEIALTPGDRIVLFTDGVSEATDAAGEMFGEPRIEELVATAAETSAEALQQRIATAATSFAGGEVEDDLTLVVVRLTPTAL